MTLGVEDSHMALRKSLIRYDRMFIVILSALFGIIGLVAAYYAASSSTESRSKAAESQTIFKQWEFNGSSAEGWTSATGQAMRPLRGYLDFAIAPLNTPSIQNIAVGAKLPAGLKTIQVSMKVERRGSTGVTRCPPNVECDYDTPVSDQPFTAKFVYAGRSAVFTGKSDGVMRRYGINLVEPDLLTIRDMQLVFTDGSHPTDAVSIDWIRLMGPADVPSKLTPTIPSSGTPYPSSSPKPGGFGTLRPIEIKRVYPSP